MANITSEDISRFEKQYRSNLINSLIGFRALNLLGTISKDGQTNVCIVSSVFHLGANPPLIGMVIRPEREHNDTLRNIKTTGQYTLNNVMREWYMQAHQTSASYPSGVSEFDTCGLTQSFLPGFKAPFVQESAISTGLVLRETIDVALNGTTIVIGEIVHIALADDLITEDGTVDNGKAQTMTVGGLDSYYLPELVGRLAYAKPGIAPHQKTGN